jgi:hypothetical protein
MMSLQTCPFGYVQLYRRRRIHRKAELDSPDALWSSKTRLKADLQIATYFATIFADYSHFAMMREALSPIGRAVGVF